MRTHPRPFLLALACSSAVLGVGLLLPIWYKTCDIVGCCGARSPVPLWKGLVGLPRVSQYEFDRTKYDNGTNGLILLSVTGGVGVGVFRACRPRTRPIDADDYSEGPLGSHPDGRL